MLIVLLQRESNSQSPHLLLLFLVSGKVHEVRQQERIQYVCHLWEKFLHLYQRCVPPPSQESGANICFGQSQRLSFVPGEISHRWRGFHFAHLHFLGGLNVVC